MPISNHRRRWAALEWDPLRPGTERGKGKGGKGKGKRKGKKGKKEREIKGREGKCQEKKETRQEANDL